MRVCFGTLCFSSRLTTRSDEEAAHQVVISNGGESPVIYSSGPEVHGGRANGVANMAEGYGHGYSGCSYEELLKLLTEKDELITKLQTELTQRNLEILELRSQLDKFQSVMAATHSHPASPTVLTGLRPRKQRAGISAEPQNEKSILEMSSTTFPTIFKSERYNEKYRSLHVHKCFSRACMTFRVRRSRTRKVMQAREKHIFWTGESESSFSSGSGNEDEPVQDARNSDYTVEVVTEVPENPYQNFSDVLGMEPEGEGALGPPLNEQIWTRWSSYITKSVDKEQIKDLFQKYPSPSNAELLQAPKVNPEVQALLTNEQKNTDNFLLKIQNDLGRGLTAVGQVLTDSLDKPERSEEAKALADAAKLFADAMHCLTTHRKFSISSKLSPSARKVAQECLPDKYLFGTDFNDRCKSAKEIEKTSREIKTFDKPSTSSKSLNFKRQNYKNRKRETSEYPSNKPQPNRRHQRAPQDRIRRQRKY